MTAKAVADGKLTNEQLGGLHRRVDDIKRRLNDGAIDYPWVMVELQRITEGWNASVRPWPFKDKRPLEWKWRGIEREGALCEAPIDISRLELVPFHKDGEEWVSGEEMMRRASDAAAFPGCQGWSQHCAEDILEQAAKLPKEWARDDGPVILFPDTVLLDDNGNRNVPYLFWDDGRWQLDWCWLGFSFYRNCRFARLRK